MKIIAFGDHYSISAQGVFSSDESVIVKSFLAGTGAKEQCCG